ncbi:MAG: hypothetical protein HEEMFOPI_00344 [Holosporales bacterium]
MVFIKKTIVFLFLWVPLYATHWCEYHFLKTENAYSIPKSTLHSIGLTESGKYIPKKGMIAWPWTININGKGYLFQTKQKAVFAAKFLKQSGYNSFDVGCMQINMMHHEDAFDSLEDAFDPEKNVAYAGYFLSTLKAQLGSWKKAVGYYHNANPSFHIPYQKKVYSFYDRLLQNQVIPFVPKEEDLNILQIHMSERFLDSESIYATSFKKDKDKKTEKIKILPIIKVAPFNFKKNHEFEKLNSLYKKEPSPKASSSFKVIPKRGGKFDRINTMRVKHFLYSPHH